MLLVTLRCWPNPTYELRSFLIRTPSIWNNNIPAETYFWTVFGMPRNLNRHHNDGVANECPCTIVQRDGMNVQSISILTVLVRVTGKTVMI